jgi:sirohydrochlorin cobaltochelatase
MNPERFRRAALVLAAHGSHLNANSAAPCYAAADSIRGRNLFAEVQETFWKQEPPFRQVLLMIESPEVFVVPFFISDGYFTETVLPRELGVTPPRSIVHGKTVHYCQPVGTHDSMTRVILHRAETAASGAGETALLIAGHGTDRNENSAKSILRQVELIRALGKYAEVHAVFMDQEPRIEKCYEMTRSPNLVVVPFFISDGLHTQEDIPRMLQLTETPKTDSMPGRVHGRAVWYTGAVGTDPAMADVILERAMQAAGD